jgi:hypothetical protein
MRESSSFKNPFRQFRAEQFTDHLWSYYVPGSFDERIGTRPIVVEGGRGSGKTMLFLCNSWRERKAEFEARQSGKFKNMLSADSFVGLYYKVDTSFVTALSEQGVEEETWAKLFATYLSASLVRELVDFLAACESSGFVKSGALSACFARISSLLGSNIDSPTVSQVRDLLVSTLDGVEVAANNPAEIQNARGTLPGRLLQEAALALRANAPFQAVRFQIFIDEYESLLEYQQRQVNSLIKHSSAWLVYNISMRPKGMKTSRTIAASEHIEEPHDFTTFRPEAELSPDTQSDDRRLEETLRSICQKRLRNLGLLDGKDDRWFEIKTYLSGSTIDEELGRITEGKHQEKTLKDLRKAIFDQTGDTEKTEQWYKTLGLEAKPEHARLHLCILRRAPQFRPSVAELANEYVAWRQSGKVGSKKYADWWHNTNAALTFLLAHEYKKPKEYAGFSTYCMLSSGIIRYFLELCEQAFDFAHSQGFHWGNPRELSVEEQTKAARYVSRYKVRDIERYHPYGAELRQLTLSLGRIFESLHKNKDTTLGEPEFNHFATSTSEIANDKSGMREILNSAVMWTVLQEKPPTKDKEVDMKIEAVDYHLNHIYSPYFGISYRRKRKIVVTLDELKALSATDQTEAGPNSMRTKLVIRSILERYRAHLLDEDQLSLL